MVSVGAEEREVERVDLYMRWFSGVKAEAERRY
jgi:hypothetical protein